MAKESTFVDEALADARSVLQPPFLIERGAALLYQVTVDNNLKLTVDPKIPVKGKSAFETDLCIFETKSDEIKIPRVVIELKERITTHDVLTYSAKARRHKQIYPYLRYGLAASSVKFVPGRFFTHNESMDFCAAMANIKKSDRREFWSALLKPEIGASRQLEQIAFGGLHPPIFRTEVMTSLASSGHG